MISIFQLFKIIFGIIISFFILFIVLRFVASYMETGEISKQATDALSLKKIIEDVYTTGISTNIQFKKNPVTFYTPPNIVTKAGTLILEQPTMLVSGKELFVYRGERDFGWWKFYFVGALPETKIIFIPLNKTEKVWSIIGALAMISPSTGESGPYTTFSLGCNGTYILDNDWSREYFLTIVIPYLKTVTVSNFNDCQLRGYTVVTVSENYTDFLNRENGILITPIDNQTGYVYKGSITGEKKYFYKDPVDILFLLFNGDDGYNYINKEFLNEIEMAADINERESSLLSQHTDSACSSAYQKFSMSLNSLKKEAEGDYTNEREMKRFIDVLENVNKDYENLKVLGCE